jgi:hypothetical protein
MHRDGATSSAISSANSMRGALLVGKFGRSGSYWLRRLIDERGRGSKADRLARRDHRLLLGNFMALSTDGCWLYDADQVEKRTSHCPFMKRTPLAVGRGSSNEYSGSDCSGLRRAGSDKRQNGNGR